MLLYNGRMAKDSSASGRPGTGWILLPCRHHLPVDLGHQKSLPWMLHSNTSMSEIPYCKLREDIVNTSQRKDPAWVIPEEVIYFTVGGKRKEPLSYRDLTKKG